MSATNTYGSRPPTNDQYESAASKGKKDEVDGIIKTIKSLKTQIKSLKDENKILKQDIGSKALAMEKMEKTILKLQNDETHQKQVNELINDVKRAEMKLRKMKERRNNYRTEKEALKKTVEDM